MSRTLLLLLGALLLALVFYNTGSDRSSFSSASVSQNLNSIASSIEGLKSALTKGELRNAEILKAYADQAAKQKPELASLFQTLAKDATPEGPAVKRLEERLAALKIADGTNALSEMQSLLTASTPSTYNDALVDSINTIADLSGGTLSKLQSPTSEANAGKATQLVGNPQYGQWVNRGGMSFWEWYGMYSMFQNVFGGRSYNYNDWSRNRPWSYYQDQGKQYYSTPYEQKTYPATPANTNTRRSSSYGRSGGVSRYQAAPPSSRRPSSYGRSSYRSSRKR